MKICRQFKKYYGIAVMVMVVLVTLGCGKAAEQASDPAKSSDTSAASAVITPQDKTSMVALQTCMGGSFSIITGDSSMPNAPDSDGYITYSWESGKYTGRYRYLDLVTRHPLLTKPTGETTLREFTQHTVTAGYTGDVQFEILSTDIRPGSGLETEWEYASTINVHAARYTYSDGSVFTNSGQIHVEKKPVYNHITHAFVSGTAVFDVSLPFTYLVNGVSYSGTFRIDYHSPVTTDLPTYRVLLDDSVISTAIFRNGAKLGTLIIGRHGIVEMRDNNNQVIPLN